MMGREGIVFAVVSFSFSNATSSGGRLSFFSFILLFSGSSFSLAFFFFLSRVHSLSLSLSLSRFLFLLFSSSRPLMPDENCTAATVVQQRKRQLLCLSFSVWFHVCSWTVNIRSFFLPSHIVLLSLCAHTFILFLLYKIATIFLLFPKSICLVYFLSLLY